MNKWLNCSKLGKEKEIEFSKLLTNTFGGEVTKTSKEDDMFRHIDIIWSYKGKTYGFDIKSAKKLNRSDNMPNYDINWIELQNVRGNPGWIYGEAHYIAFETLNDWLIVRRMDIIDFINSKVINKTISKNKDLYTYYQRDNRQDIVVKVLTDDLRKIAKVVLNK